VIHLAALSVRLRLSQSNPLTPASGAPTALQIEGYRAVKRIKYTKYI
jgi:DMSO/TMAO reductase YedYZ molybdopterin-dependent catalytic subunit